MFKFVAAVAIVAATSSLVQAQSNSFNKYAKACPTYGGRSANCDNNGWCSTYGKQCVVSCTQAGKTNCKNTTSNPIQNMCQLSYQDSDPQYSQSCTWKCEAITDWKACFSIRNGYCTWYNGKCRTRCSSLRDKGACGTNTETCTWSEKAKRCNSRCSKFSTYYSCASWMSGCDFNSATGKCTFECDDAGSDATECAKHSHCEMFKAFDGTAKCLPKCTGVTKKEACRDAGCMWYKSKCTQTCNRVRLPQGAMVNESTRQMCKSHSPLCSTTASNTYYPYCQTVNCSLVTTNKWDCEKGTRSCTWYGSSDTVGTCTTSCSSEWSYHRKCPTTVGTQKRCHAKRYPDTEAYGSNRNKIYSCRDNACGNFTTLNYCKARGSYNCLWTSGDKCVKSCQQYSTQQDQPKKGDPSKCETEDKTNCVRFTSGPKEAQSVSCMPKCGSFTAEKSCLAASSCIWHNAKCMVSCTKYRSQAECSDSACMWVNDTLNRASCKIKCSIASDFDSCTSSAMASSGCWWAGGDDCRCFRICEISEMGECSSPCYKSSVFGGHCMSPSGAYTLTKTCSSGLSAAALGGVIGGVIAFIIIAAVVGAICFFFVCKKAASGGSDPNGMAQPMGGQPGYVDPNVQAAGGMGMQQPMGGQPGYAQPGMGQPGMGQPGMGQPGMGQPGYAQPGMGQPGMGMQQQPMMGGQPGYAQPGMGQPMMQQPGGHVDL